MFIEVMADTGIGRTVETVLGIPMNDSKKADYKKTALKPNAQGLGLNLNWSDEWLEMNHYALAAQDTGKFRKLNDVSVWTLLTLHQRLAEKHHETFWIDVESRIRGSVEEFRVSKIEHTKNPILPQFDVLLEQGKIKLDLMLSRPSGRGDTYSFKMLPKYRPLLFPESQIYMINPI